MRTLRASVALLFLFAVQSAHAVTYFPEKLLDVLKATLPDMKFVSGDPTWNGGLSNNAFFGSTALYTDSAYTQFESGRGGTAPSPQEIARQVSAVLCGKYHLVIDRDGRWPKPQPPGLANEDFAASYAMGTYTHPEWGPAHVVFTVQVVRLSPLRFGITLTYIALSN